MNEISIKQRLVDYMIANGNSFTYTEMVKALLKLKNGENFQYDWREHRGYFATNFTHSGYMTRGCGSCGVYKDEKTKTWKARYYTKKEITTYVVNRLVTDLNREMELYTNLYAQEQKRLGYSYDYKTYEDYVKLKRRTRNSYVKRLVSHALKSNA